MKVQISINEDLINRVDDIAKKNGFTRSGLISVACTNYCNTQAFYDLSESMSRAFDKCAETGTLDEVTMKQLQSFSLMLQTMNSK